MSKLPTGVEIRGKYIRIWFMFRGKRCRETLKGWEVTGFAPIFPDICYHLTHYKPAAADIPVASDN
ncbi:Arm DNA-binding domain-containing protein, partial [Escherichia coli]|uniref:Arm DNA-binding domain-containing protein n=1 Tax=Escherichia coli TaxID=562 RepID=UPI002036C01E